MFRRSERRRMRPSTHDTGRWQLHGLANLFPDSASPSPAARPASGWRWSANSSAAARTVAFVARTARRRRARRGRASGAHGIVGDVSNARTTSIRSRVQILGALGGLDVLVNNASDPRAGAAGAARRHRMRGPRARAGDQRARPVSSDQGAARRAAASAREGRGAVVVNMSSDAAVNAYPRLGRLRRQQGGAAASEPDLERGAGGGGRARAVDRSGRHGHAAARRSRCPTPTARTLKRPETRRASSPMSSATRWRARAVGAAGWRRRRMIAAAVPVQRRADAKLLVVDRRGRVHHWPRARVRDARCEPGDLVIANDAATLPASLAGRHVRERRADRGAARRRDVAATSSDVTAFTAVVFGAGDFRMRTEDRPPPPPVAPGDRLALGPLRATVHRATARSSAAGRAATSRARPATIWEGLARHGRPIQYAHVPQPLALWDTWTPIAGAAGRVRAAVGRLRARLAHARRRCAHAASRFATITHAAGISSTGDPELDALLPFDEPYRIPERTAVRYCDSARDGRRIVAIGTTVVRALEHAGRPRRRSSARGEGMATQRIGPRRRCASSTRSSRARTSPARATTSLLRAFADDGRSRASDGN